MSFRFQTDLLLGKKFIKIRLIFILHFTIVTFYLADFNNKLLKTNHLKKSVQSDT